MISKIRVISFVVLIIYYLPNFSQNIDDIDYGSSNTLEIITWNIERFPKRGNTTITKVRDIINALNADIIAVQEVQDISSFNQVVNGLDSYNGYLDSNRFAGLAFIYNTNTIEINDIYEIYATEEYLSPFPRYPMVIDFNFKNKRYFVINNHFKCCGDGNLDLNYWRDEETRRYNASVLLKEYIDDNLSEEQVIVLGDLNDELSDQLQDNVFRTIILDSDNYVFTDMDIANGSSSDWSFPNWPSHLDHILITNELFDEFENEESNIETLKIENYLDDGWYEYDRYVSDHRPVALKLFTDNNLSTDEESLKKVNFINSPNPFKLETKFTFNANFSADKIDIYNLNGQKIKSIQIDKNKSELVFNNESIANGVYVAKLQSKNNTIASKKIVILK